MTLAEKMINFRAENNLSARKLAIMVGTTERTILKIEHGGKYRAVTERKILNIIESGE